MQRMVKELKLPCKFLHATDVLRFVGAADLVTDGSHSEDSMNRTDDSWVNGHVPQRVAQVASRLSRQWALYQARVRQSSEPMNKPD
jgi:hypothetical protein